MSPTYPFEAWLADQGRATPAEAASVVAALATQLDAARSVGLVPGTAIPRWVRIDPSGAPVLDVWSASQRKAPADDLGATRGRFGPPPGEAADERSDVYALGIVLYHLLAGRYPFGGSNPVEWALAHRHEQPAAPSCVAAGVPEPLDALTIACLAKDPSARPATLAMLADRLTGKLPEELITPRPPAPRAAALPSERAPEARPVERAAGEIDERAPRGARPLWVALAVAGIAGAGVVGWKLAASSPARPGFEIHASPSAAVNATPRIASNAAPPSDAAPRDASPVVQPSASPSAPVAPASAAVAAPPARPATRGATSVETERRKPREVRTPPAPETAPAPAPVLASASLDSSADVTRLLGEGDVLLRQKKYLGGTEPGALDRYRAALALAPGNREAQQKVELIRGTYLALSRERGEKGDFDAASRYLSGLEHAFPGDAEIERELLAVDAERAAASRTGELAIDVHPWGNVFIDGRLQDQTPMPPVKLEAGTHKIEVEGEHGLRQVRQVVVRGGESQRLSIDLVRTDG